MWLHLPPIQQVNGTLSISSVVFGMGRLYNRHAIIIQFLKQFHYLGALFGVQVARRLIGQDQFRFTNQGAGDPDQLLLPPTQLRRE